MRARYDQTCKIYAGPTTATPYQLKAEGVPCRRVPNDWFEFVEEPLRSTFAYVTLDAEEPIGPQTLEGANGHWDYDFGKADRIEFSTEPGVLWIAASVLHCTWPDQVPYFRSPLLETDETILTPCQRIYRTLYFITFSNGSPNLTMTRVGPTTWTNGDNYLVAESTGPPGLSCVSTWRLVAGSIWTANMNGQFADIMFSAIPGSGTANISPGPPS